MRHRVSSGVLETSTKDHPLASHLRHTPIFSAAATDATAAPELKSNPLTWHGELLTRKDCACEALTTTLCPLPGQMPRVPGHLVAQ